ncbi:hypothetical protein Patl1_36617 [Pistacia atlantica]|nr:hypothetical protein Patl1_36617 [Pistacia atlantica]
MKNGKEERGHELTATISRDNHFRRLTDAELQYKRERGLCYKCDEKFGPPHRCKNRTLQVLLVMDAEEEQREAETMVTNEINWHGSSEKDPSAVHIDVLHAGIMGINMSVGINGSVGKPMIQDGQGLDIYVRRSLRDVFRKVPTVSVEVKVGSLHGVMSHKEYDVILNCTFMNLNEAPNLLPSFRGSKSDSNDTMRLLVHKFNLNSQMLLSHSVTIIAVEVDYALLELCIGITEESALAHVALEGLWVSYRMTSSSGIDLYVTIPKFSIMDIRPNVPVSTMFLMDYRWRASSQSYVVWVQKPRVLVVPDFLLAIGEFFVPALGAIIGRDEKMDPKNDPISRNNSIVLSGPVYTQSEDVVHLSPGRQLIADAVGVDEYTYDGCGKIICLSEEKHMKDFQLAKY